jgi:hypothetical protein
LGFSLKLWKILEVFQISYGVVPKAPCLLIEDTPYRSYTNVLVGQGLGLVNTSSHSDGFAKLEGSVPQGQYGNGHVTFGKGTNPRPSASSICGVVLSCELRKDVDVISALRDLKG